MYTTVNGLGSNETQLDLYSGSSSNTRVDFNKEFEDFKKKNEFIQFNRRWLTISKKSFAELLFSLNRSRKTVKIDNGIIKISFEANVEDIDKDELESAVSTEDRKCGMNRGLIPILTKIYKEIWKNKQGSLEE